MMFLEKRREDNYYKCLVERDNLKDERKESTLLTGKDQFILNTVNMVDMSPLSITWRCN